MIRQRRETKSWQTESSRPERRAAAWGEWGAAPLTVLPVEEQEFAATREAEMSELFDDFVARWWPGEVPPLTEE